MDWKSDPVPNIQYLGIQFPVDEEEVPRREAGLRTRKIRGSVFENREISGSLQGWPRPSSSPPEM